MKYSSVTYTPVDQAPPATAKAKPKRSWSGWRGTVALGCAGAGLVLLINLGVLIWAVSRFPIQAGIASIYRGSCATAKSISIWTHLLINILSTLLLAASNAGMQVVVAPTRAEIDRAHARRRWVDVGVHTVRNLMYIARSRLALWALLGLSSVPLHLLYNSVIFETTNGSEYAAMLVGAEFLTGGDWNRTQADCFYPGAATSVAWMQDNLDSLVRLDNAACIAAFGSSVQQDYGNVLLVSGPQPGDNLLGITQMGLAEWAGANPTSWLCAKADDAEARCDIAALRAAASTWTQPAYNASQSEAEAAATGHSCMFYSYTNDVPVEYCLARPAIQQCEINLSVAFLAVVIVCNALKVIGLAVAALRLRFDPLVTVGDAIASFLTRPDPTTVGQCLFARTDAPSWANGAVPPSPRVWKSHYRNGFSAASTRRWIVCSAL